MVKDATTSPAPPGSPSPLASSSTLVGNNHGGQDSWPKIATKDQIPGWLRDNDYIIRGHPMPTYSYRRSFCLWRCLHMETMNIWTHLVGSVAFIGAGITFYNYASNSSTIQFAAGDKLAIGCSITASVVCFGLSTAFHTLRSHSYNVHHFWGRMDIFGICLLALGGGASMNYYAFYCRPAIQRAYWGLSLASSILAAVTLFDTGGGGGKMRTLRGSVFILLAVSAMLPMFHSLGLLGWDRACREVGAAWYLTEGLSLLVGVCLFVGRIPERSSPGSFDIWGHSHQLFHICAVLGGAFHVAGLVTGLNYRQTHLVC